MNGLDLRVCPANEILTAKFARLGRIGISTLGRITSQGLIYSLNLMPPSSPEMPSVAISPLVQFYPE
jgi:hypothetical protein